MLCRYTKRFAHTWSVSSTITDRKSVFEGRAVRIRSIQEADELIAELKQDKRIKKATHNISALRLGDGTERFNDDGEPPAGERVLNLLKVTNTTNVLIVVTRWYGGVQLGGARFKHVGKTAHEALKNLV